MNKELIFSIASSLYDVHKAIQVKIDCSNMIISLLIDEHESYTYFLWDDDFLCKHVKSEVEMQYEGSYSIIGQVERYEESKNLGSSLYKEINDLF